MKCLTREVANAFSVKSMAALLSMPRLNGLEAEAELPEQAAER